MESQNDHATLKELKDHSLATKLELRRGTVVTLITNLDINAGLCNGSQGRVVAFEEHHQSKIAALMKKAGDTKAANIASFISRCNPANLLTQWSSSALRMVGQPLHAPSTPSA